MKIKVLYTKYEGGVWTPIYLHNIDEKGLIDNLLDDIGSLDIEKIKRTSVKKDLVDKAIIKNILTSTTVEPKKIIGRDLLIHSIMISTGLIYDSTIGLDYSFYEVRCFGMSAKRFEELWKGTSANARDLWIEEKSEQARAVRLKKNIQRRKGKKNNE